MSKFKRRLGLGSVGLALACIGLVYAAGRRPTAKPPAGSPSADRPTASLEALPQKPPAGSAEAERLPVQEKAVTPVVILPETPRPFFEVWSSNEQMEPEERRVFERVRDALADHKSLPEHRVKHFSWLEAHNLRASSWTADLMQAEPIENGHLVSLRVVPRIGSPSSQVSVIDWSIERYKVFRDGTWTFVDGTTPPGTGQAGWMID